MLLDSLLPWRMVVFGRKYLENAGGVIDGQGQGCHFHFSFSFRLKLQPNRIIGSYSFSG